MAKAKAICKCKYCGNEFHYVTYKNNSRDARDFEKWAAENIDECPECREKRIAAEHDEQARISAEAAKSKGWPELTGSEKQISWANTIRETHLSEIIEKIEKEKSRMGDKYKGYALASAAVNAMLTHTKASWWIDNRCQLDAEFCKIANEINETGQTPVYESNPAQQDKATIAKPENQVFDGIADIQASEEKVSVSYPKNDKFREIVKALGYRWDADNRSWMIKINYASGSSAERAAELGNKLLNAGFSIRIQDPDTLRNAIEGKYEPMYQRWISKSVKTGNFIISWARNDDFYDKAKRLPGAKYVSPNIQVPAKEFESILDFAHTYGFRLSPGAQDVINEMQCSTVTVQPAAAKDPVYDAHPLADVLNSSRDIIEDLKDEINN